MNVSGYRSDVDGLRALAVVPVVLFHAGIGGFSGGFVGVDVFFVISGFLITGILLADVERGRFSVLGFYDRRIRRIFPALIAMIVAVLACGLVLLIPGELTDLAKSAISAVLFSSNVWFWKTASYFGPAPQELPLLHTWSLAVEEQFYIVWPLVIAVLGRPRWRRHLLPFTLAALLTSLVLAEGLLRYTGSAAFYMFPPRAWELLAGAALAVAPGARLASRGTRQIAALLGAALVVLPILLYSPHTRFPGLSAVPPVAGAALMILANERQDTWVARLLGTRPFVAVGMISYSLYLWHWPVLALHYLSTGGMPSLPASLALVAGSFVLGYLSWRFVEGPFRRATHRKSLERVDQRRVIATGLASILVVSGGAATLIATHGLPQRLPAAARIAALYPVEPFEPEIGCSTRPATEQEFLANCFGTDRERNATTILWGDSHARSLAAGLTAKAARQHRDVVSVVMNSCAPLVGVATTKQKASFAALRSRQPCARANDRTFKAVLASKTLQTVVVVSRWNRFNPSNEPGGDEADAARYLIDARSNEATPANTFRALHDSLSYMASSLDDRGKRMVIVKQAPSFLHSVRSCVVRQRWAGTGDRTCSIDAASLAARRVAVNHVIDQVAATHRNVRVVDLLPVLCDHGTCPGSQGGIPLYIDSHHLSQAGSLRAAQAFPIDYFGNAAAPQTAAVVTQ